jgi:hypothetical protein
MSHDASDLQSSLTGSARAHRARRWRTVVTASIVLIILGSVGALLKSAVDKVRDAAARTTSV